MAPAILSQEPVRQPGLPNVTVAPKHDESRMMKGVEWHGKKDMRVVDRPVPMITDPEDVIIKVTSTAICGSDLHLYLNALPGMKAGDLLGHEFMGFIETVGPEVKDLKVGDRVVAAFDLACGRCLYCHKQLFTSCDVTNPRTEGASYTNLQEKLYGHRTAGLHGYSHMTGGWEGGQAEYARVPFAEKNLLKIPDEGPDEKYLLLSDVLATAWHASELGEVSEGDVVAIWGCGPVGILAAQCCFARGAKRVIIIDNQPYRLERAKDAMPNIETIDFSKRSTTEQLHEMVEHGPDVAIEAVGFHYASKWWNKVEMALMLETDPSEILNELIHNVRKGGKISVVGVYSGYCNHYNIGAFMEKGLTMKAGQTPTQKYWHKLLELVESGKLNPTVVISHEAPLTAAAEMYKIFNDKQDDCVKVVLKPGLIASADVAGDGKLAAGVKSLLRDMLPSSSSLLA